MTDEDWSVLWSEITDAFSPGAPVQEKDLFSGRIEQIRALVDTVSQRGRHGIIFGERGVGKTSLANIVSLVIQGQSRNVITVKVNADPQDSFSSIWRKVFRRLSYDLKNEDGTLERRVVAEDHAAQITPDDVILELSSFGANSTPVIMIDEFDRIADSRATTLMADTIKALSDYSSKATVIIVGVAEDVGDLIEGHRSISRALLQVKMPRMDQGELSQIIESRYGKCGLKCDDEALWKMTFLSRGLPYYAQLLGMHSARQAIQDRRREVLPVDVEASLGEAVLELDQTIKEAYLAAIRSQRGDALYGPVLLACALAKGDELGAFQQAAVTEPLNRILPGRNYKPSTFAFHMNEFTQHARKRVLERFGEPRNYRYRFADPLMQPFVIMKGLAEGVVDDVTAEVYANRRQGQLSTNW
ncbi:AAA family ATPase [Luteimonas dalianensis]|uniref:nSTAND1 domain-containing NTPase n=1 Tax=Luteimonas dalianensis TaxID=1148196 RepID=UPI003BF2F954